jgi:pimeloyl-ACP methyl ester carboxylesterase
MNQAKRSRLARRLLRFLVICWLGWNGVFWCAGQGLNGGVFLATNLGGAPIVDEFGVPLATNLGYARIVYGATVLVDGPISVADGFFDFGPVIVPGAFGPTELTINAWDRSRGWSFAQVVAGPLGGWGVTNLIVPLSTGSDTPVSLIQAGFRGLQLFESPLDASPGFAGESVSTNHTILAQTNTYVFSDKLTYSTDWDYRGLYIEKGQRLEIVLNGESALDGLVQVYQFSSVEINDDGVRPASVSTNQFDSYLRFTPSSSGVYLIGVTTSGNPNPFPIGKRNSTLRSVWTKYRLQLSYGIAAAVIGDGVADFMREDQLRMAIDPSRTTWVVIHGWGASRKDESMKRLISAVVGARPGDQVLSLDWSAMAGTPDLDGRLVAAKSIVPVAKWAAAVMQDYGFKPERLHFIGHSMGAHLADEIAKRFPSKVASLVAIDPAANCCAGAFDPIANGEVDFARDAEASWAFYGSTLGSEEASLRAHESFLIESALPPVEAHQRVLKVATALIGAATNSFPATFGLGNLADRVPGPWGMNQFASGFPEDRHVRGFEALIRSTNQGSTISVQYLTNGPVVTAGFAPRQAEVPQVVVEGTVAGLPSGSGPGWVGINGIAAQEMVSTGPGTIRWMSRLPLHWGANEFEITTLSGPSGSVLSTVLLEEVYGPDPSIPPKIEIELPRKHGDVSRFLLKIIGAPLSPVVIEEGALEYGWSAFRNGVLEFDPQQPDGRGHLELEVSAEWYWRPQFFRARYLEP